MDCLVAIASTPAAISGRNMMWREMISQAIRSDPAWKNGDYPKDAPPKNWLKAAISLSATMTGSAEQLQKQAPNREKAIELVDKLEADGEAYDANDMLYAFESSADYDPAPKLNAIIKPMLTINFADDLTNPPEHLHLPTASNYTEVMFPAGPASYGHMTLAHPAVWASALQSFLQRLLPALPIQVALAAEGIAASAHAQTPQATSKPAGPPNPLFPDDAEFWYETLGMLGADEYGAGSFGEVLAICRQIKAGDYDS
jgi:homoserine O-acetyltransferase